MKLNSYQKQVMHGLMLGDGHIANNKSNAEVKILSIYANFWTTQ